MWKYLYLLVIDGIVVAILIFKGLEIVVFLNMIYVYNCR